MLAAPEPVSSGAGCHLHVEGSSLEERCAGGRARRAGCSGLAATSAFVCLGAGLALAPVEGPVMHPRGAGADSFVRSASSG